MMDVTVEDDNSIEITDVLNAMANLMATFRQSDLALQDALSSMAARARSTPEMHDLQHIDLITQTHEDLARLLPVLAEALQSETVDKDSVKSALTLRSLQDQLLSAGQPTETQIAGEILFF